MNKFFNYYNSLCIGSNSPNVFSFDPYLIAIKEMLIFELRQIVFYIEKLKDLNVNMSLYRDKVIEFISVLIVNLDFKKESFFAIVEDLYENKNLLQDMYNSECEKQGVLPQKIDVIESKLVDKGSIIKILNDYEQNLSNDLSSLSLNKKILYQIMINLVLNACNCLIDLKNYGIDFVEAKEEVLKLFNASNFINADESEWIRTIRTFAKCNYKIMLTLNNKIIEKYGPISKSVVPLSTKKGKAILVSGYNFSDLDSILNAVVDYDINVYTHHEMINAFKYEKFNSNPHLVAHYQLSDNNFSLDFSSFPGPIYISKNSTPKIDVIRGQIYTSAKYPSYGIAKVENNDFSQIIEYALKSKGFQKDEITNSLFIGFNENDINLKLDEILSKFISKEISHIAIIGFFDNFSPENEYISEFFEKAPDDCYIISFSHDFNRDNFWFVNSFFEFTLLYKIIENLFSVIDSPSKNISVFFVDCSNTILSHIFNLIYIGLSKIYLGPCCPNIISPILLEGLKSLFSINEISTPIDDLKQIMK